MDPAIAAITVNSILIICNYLEQTPQGYSILDITVT